VAAVWLGAWLAEPVLQPWLHRGGPDTSIPLPRAEGFLTHDEDAERYAELAALVAQHVPEDGTIFVGERRHDAVIVNDPRLYFLLARRPATPYHELHPGVADTAAVQEEIVAALERQATPLVILRDTFPDPHLDAFRDGLRAALPGAGIGATRLDRYLARRYETIARLGRLEVRRRIPPGDAQEAPAADDAPR
jgi:hypothetical protein